MTGIDLSGGRNGKAPVVKLSSGCDLPVVGLGTYALHGNTCMNAVRTALESGYRLIDTASFYGNEREVGEGVRASDVPREEVVVQTKLYPNQYGHAARAIEERSTFYLHYETIGDLLAESVQYMNEQFLEHMKLRGEVFVSKIRDCPLDELYLVTPAYLTPYLEYIAQNKRLFRTALKNSGSLGLDRIYSRMMRHVFTPILERFQIAEPDRPYMVAFYIHGLMAILSEWLKHDCADSIPHVCAVMEQCVMGGRGKQEEAK